MTLGARLGGRHHLAIIGEGKRKTLPIAPCPITLRCGKTLPKLPRWRKHVESNAVCGKWVVNSDHGGYNRRSKQRRTLKAQRKLPRRRSRTTRICRQRAPNIQPCPSKTPPHVQERKPQSGWKKKTYMQDIYPELFEGPTFSFEQRKVRSSSVAMGFSTKQPH